MAGTRRFVVRLHVFTLAAVVWSPVLSARPTGFAVECGGCHYGQLAGGGMAPVPLVNASTLTRRVEPGEALDITVTVESKWADAVVAGFLVMTEAGGGVFTSSEEGTGNVGSTDGQTLEYAIGHTMARELEAGSATFHATWTAPATAGAYDFAVFGVTSDDGDGIDDPDLAEESNEPFARFGFTVGVGCDVVAHYLDADGDGYGGEEEQVMACETPAGYVAQGGDCRDDDAAINPGAQELCSFVDENCDGVVMAPPTFYRDGDGDGYGAASEISVDGCELPAGYAAEAGDCALTDPAIHPGAVELPGNTVDDDCDGQVDEAGTQVNTDSETAESPGTSGAPDSSESSAPAPSSTMVPANTTTTPIDTAMQLTTGSGTAPVNSSGCDVALRQAAKPSNAERSRGGAWVLALLVLVCCTRRRT